MRRVVAGRTVVLVAAAAGVVLVQACAKAEGGATATRPAISTVPEQTTTTNPYAVPPVIDAAYVNRVLAGLDAAMGDVVRMVMKAGSITPEAHERMKAIYSGDTLTSQSNFLIQDSARGFAGIRPNPGNRKTTVTKVLTGQPHCVFVQVSRDFSLVAEDPRSDISEQYVGLELLNPSSDPNSYNPSGGAIMADGFEKDRSQPTDPCAAESQFESRSS